MYLCPPLSTTLTEPGQESPKTSALPSTVEEGSSPKNFLWGNLREPLPSTPPSNNLRAADWLLHKNTGSLHYDAATLVYFLFLNLLWTLLEGGLALGVIQSRTATVLGTVWNRLLLYLSSLISISFSRSSSLSLFIFTCKHPLPDSELWKMFSFATCILSREALHWDSRAARASVTINPTLIGHLKHFVISQFDNLINSLYFTDNLNNVKINVTRIIWGMFHLHRMCYLS